MNKPEQDKGLIDTKDFGLCVSMNTKRKFFRKVIPAELIELNFDTGVIMYVPEALVMSMKLHLQEKDPN